MNSEAAERKVSDRARAAALVVIDNLSDRRGLSFDGIDAETMAEIADAIAEIAQAHFDAARAEDAERIGELEREVKHDERAHGDTIDDRDRYSDCLQEIDVALGGTGEWSNLYDTAGEAVERSKQVAAARAKDAERIAELESEKEAAWAEVESFAAETDKARAEIARLTEVARQCDIRACKEKGSRHASEEKMGTDIDRLTADLETAQRAFTDSHEGGIENLREAMQTIARLTATTLDAEAIESICEGLEKLYPDAPTIAGQLVGVINMKAERAKEDQ